MKKFLVAYLFVYLFSLSSNAAVNPSKWRFEYNIGKAKTHYIEEQPSIVFTAQDIEQESLHQDFIFQYFLSPPWIDLSFGSKITGYQVDTPEEKAEQFTYISAFANLGFLFSITDYIQMRFVTEYFYTTMVVDDDAFGFRNLSGTQIYPEFEFLPYGSDIFFQISPYFKFPLWSDIGNRKETTIGLKIRIPTTRASEQRFPTFAYQNAFMIKIFYTNMHLNFERSGFITSEMDIKQYGATLGFNF